MASQIEEDIELIRWQGDTTSANPLLDLCDGHLVKLCADGANLAYSNGGAVNSSNVLATFNTVVNSLPASVRFKKADLRIRVSSNVAAAYELAAASGNTLTYVSAPLQMTYLGIKVIVCITEGIPVNDMVKAKEYIKVYDCRLIGPNCPGVITAGEAKVGIMPGFVFKKGKIGIVSKSGTLTYEAADQVAKAGLGITTAIGIGGDPIIGTTTKEAVELLMNDPETEGIIMIGEIGGNLEAIAARWIKDNAKKPVIGFIAGETAPKGRTMGHAGAIVGGDDDTAEAKKRIMRECGIHVVDSPAHIGAKMAEVLGIKA
jgi:succinyl-CoA synthetase alpha subunit